MDRYSTPDQFQQIEYNLNRSPSLSSTLLNLAADTGLGYYGAGAVTPRPIIQRTSMRRLNTGATVPFTTAWQGAPNPLISQQQQVSFEGFNVFNINSVVSREVSSQTSSLFGVQQAAFNMVNDGGNIITTREINLQPRGNYSTSVTSNIPGKRSATPTASDYTHRLSSINSTSVGTAYRDRTNIMAYGWTHVSSEKTNRILPNRITQIPFVKGNITGSGTHVRSGPDHTGGSLVSMGGDAQFGMVVTSSVRQRYHVRLRYAAPTSVDFRLRISALGVDYNFTLPGGGASFNPDLRYSSFQYITLPIEFETPNSLLNFDFSLDTRTLMNGTCLFDRVEFMPANSTALDYEGERSLKKAKKAVDDLFTNNAKEALKVDTTDYNVDQAANLVECVLEELYAKEKMILLDEVKHAKQLSASRNLIQNGNFAFYTDEWTTSNNVSIQADNPIFKGNYLKMPGARETEGGTTRFPTYVLQKIDESKLKPYTRYKARGFVGS
ncbi:delta endotoxin C-terminal domain-containing protein, partial [Bacillus thuringiensis]|nr:delta endotoxin C-terminal domain-containing protein [Bacillus thuringiensis]